MNKYLALSSKYRYLLNFNELICFNSFASAYRMKQHASQNFPHSSKKTKGVNGNMKWPSESHCIVNFFHHNDKTLNLVELTENCGRMKDHVVKKDNKNLYVTKVEMSNCSEAKVLWQKYSQNLPKGVATVKPELNIKTLTMKETYQKPQKQKKVFADYWPINKVNEGIRRHEIIKGTLRINAKKYTHAFISDEDGRDILINGLVDRNRALEGDIVAVKINDESEWIIGTAHPSTTSAEGIDMEIKKLSLKSSDNEQLNQLPAFKHTRKTGNVVAILEKKHCRTVTGHIKKDGTKGLKKDQLLFSPTASTFPRLIINKSQLKNDLANVVFDKILYVAKIKHWSAYFNIPQGELVEVVGNKGEVETETQCILIDHDIDYKEFPDDVCNSLPQVLHISDAERAKRRDFTKECVFSIDPSTAKDLDDALHCKEISSDVYEVGVHIADVSHFVKQGSLVDEIAKQRCTSVYLVQKVIPMLPSILCEELCSLNPACEKLSFSVVWTLTKKGKILSEWFGKSIISSCAKLSYDHAQCFINNPTEDFSVSEGKNEDFPEITGGFCLRDIQEKVLILHKIAQNLRQQRFSNGALQLDQVKLAYTLSETGLPTGCYAYERKESNELIEEFMLLANMAVAHNIYKNLSEQAFLRCHPEPKENMMEDFVNHCQSIGLAIDSSSSGSLAETIASSCGNDELSIYRKQALFMFAIKPQQLASYFCAGMEPNKKNYHHYALNVPLYTHFTSPIRRYADIIVHRQLAKVLKVSNDDMCSTQSPEELQSQAELCNQRKYNAKIAQELSVELFLNLLVNNYGPFVSNAMIMYVNDRSIDVLSMEYGVIKRVYVDAIPGVMYTIQQKTSANGQDVNRLVLKWTDQYKDQKENDSAISLPYDETVAGIVQTLDVLSVVKIVLHKQEPESAMHIKAVLQKPV